MNRRISIRLAGLAASLCLLWSAMGQPSVRRPDESGNVQTADTFHILVQDQKAAVELLREILSAPDARQLQRFKDVARRASKDPGSAPAGGDLGTVYEGEMVERFEAAIFSGRAGEVLGPFRSEFGWHLAYVTRFGEQPVRELCRRPVEAELANASGGYRTSLILALHPVDPELLPRQIESLLGPSWMGPLWDGSGNLLYLNQSAQSPSQERTRLFTRHIEFTYGKLRASTKPMGCARSAREQWLVDCESRSVALTRLTEFEGRGAFGRQLTLVEQATPELIAVKPGTLGQQLIDLACKVNAPVDPRAQPSKERQAGWVDRRSAQRAAGSA